MVKARNYAFRVHPQKPNCQASTQAHGVVINCRKPNGKRTARVAKEVRSYHVTFAAPTRKRGRDEETGVSHAISSGVSPPDDEASTTRSSMATSPTRPEWPPRSRQDMPVKLRRSKKIKGPYKGVDLDCWFTILSFSHPAQLLELRIRIPSCFHFLRDNPKLWKHSRNYHHGTDLPDPCSELTEFQYTDLLHGHGCQDPSCAASVTRKTYWAFLRRWCKKCLQEKIYKDHEAVEVLRAACSAEDLPFLLACLPAAIHDSWGNFVGSGPATTHSLKTIYLKSDVHKLVRRYNELSATHKNSTSWATELHAWYEPQAKVIEERRLFAKDMEAWEEGIRNARSQDYALKKAARKLYFQAKASQLDPALSARELECCPSFGRAIRIPKDPNMASWQQLVPKLLREIAEFNRSSDQPPPMSSNSRASTPTSVIPQLPPQLPPQPCPQSQQQFALPSIGQVLESTHGSHASPPPHHQSRNPPHGQGVTLPQTPGAVQLFNQGPTPAHMQAPAHPNSHSFDHLHSQTLAPLHSQAFSAPQGQPHSPLSLPPPQGQPHSPGLSLPPPSNQLF